MIISSAVLDCQEDSKQKKLNFTGARVMDLLAQSIASMGEDSQLRLVKKSELILMKKKFLALI